EQLYADLRVATNHNPIIDVISDQHALDLVSSGGYIYQSQNDGTAMVEVEGKCYTFIYSEGLPYRSAHFLFRQGSPWVDVLNAQILRNYPFVNNVYDRYFKLRQHNRAKCPPGMFATPGATDPL
ncbi:hypothetical protein PMAYCL1PPCAC_21458, partial [Pristionchus mayeri]